MTTVHKTFHQHFSGRLVKSQVDYCRSAQALITAKLIIGQKIHNSRLILTSYIRSRCRSGNDQASFLLNKQNKLARLETQLDTADNRQKVFLIEAEASRIYWSALRLICHQALDWCRVHPQATDSLNVLLNSGYVMLARKCLVALTKAGLLVELGLLHGENSREPLVYDFMECFRQTLVDVVIIPFFSRRPSGIERGERMFKKTLFTLARRYQDRALYCGRCETFENILFLEAIKLRQAILSHRAWGPHPFPWGHHNRRCVADKKKPLHMSDAARMDV